MYASLRDAMQYEVYYSQFEETILLLTCIFCMNKLDIGSMHGIYIL